MKFSRIKLLGAALCVLVGASSAFAASATGPLGVSKANPRYFADPSGKAIYLTGLHTWNNLVDMGATDPPPVLNYGEYLDFMLKHNNNFMRMWAWELTKWDTENNGQKQIHTVFPHPWARTGPGTALDGKPKFDLTKFESEYFDRLRARVSAAGDRGIYVSIMLFEGWGMQFVKDAWKSHPFNPENNINGIGGDIDNGLKIHELASTPVLRAQEAYVRHVIDTVNDLDNVLYEISNENHPPSTPWQYHIINFIHRAEKSKPKQHPVGMTFQYKDGSNQTLFESPAEWVSPNADGGYRDNPPAADGRKVILNDTDHLWGIGGNQAWVWKSFTRGLNPLFMDPYDNKVLSRNDDWGQVRRSLGYTRALAERVDLARMIPRTDLASTGYCLANPGAEYVVYNPAEDAPKLTLRIPAGAYEIEWINPDDGQSVARDSLKIEAASGEAVERAFESPIKGDSVLYIKRPGK